MANAHFFELWRCAGVDQTASPFPGMVVPAGGSNLVVLEGAGMDLKVASNNSGIQLKKIDDTVIRQKLVELNNVLMQPGEDAQRREAFLPTPLFHYYSPTVWEISSKNPTGFPGALVQATLKGKPKATLQVVVLKPMPVKVAIRKVMARDADGNMVEQGKRPFDVNAEFANMNAVWTAQTNIVFDLVPSPPLEVDIRDKATREELGKGYGLKDPNTADFPPEVNPDRLKDFFNKRKVRGAHITFFIVDKIVRDSRSKPNGTMFADIGVGWISTALRGPTTLPHEAGHFLGGSLDKGEFTEMPHTHDDDRDEDIRHLMRDGGAGWKIPFKKVEFFRKFADRHPVH